MMDVANITISNIDERVKRNFEQFCTQAGMNMSAAFDILVNIAIGLQGILPVATSALQANRITFQEQQRNAVREFITLNNAITNDELNTDDYAEFQSGKYKMQFSGRELDL